MILETVDASFMALRGLKIISGTNIKVLKFPPNYNHFNFYISLAIVLCIDYLRSRFITTAVIYLFLVRKFLHTFRYRTFFYSCL